MNAVRMLFLPTCLLALSASAQTDSDAYESVDIKSKQCLATRQIKSTVVIDDANILFFTRGNSVYHNRLPEACKGLLRYKTFSYEQIAGRICEADLITLFRNTDAGIIRRCRIGKFDSMDSQDIPALIQMLHRPPTGEELPTADVEDVVAESD
ncbi:MAG: hypothetical protein P8M18_06980 [Woeseiaceae bacterium]|nr:hypothetical protein [Woeseiaceae bacterium]